jgi:hypothetical protein
MTTQPYWENLLYIDPQPVLELIPNSQWFRFCSKAIAQAWITTNLTGGNNPLASNTVLQDQTSMTFPMAIHVSVDDVGVWVITGNIGDPTNGPQFIEYVGDLIDRQTNPNPMFDPNVNPNKPVHLIANIIAPGECELRWSN